MAVSRELVFPTTFVGWKIFRVWNTRPRTLVHGVRGSTRLLLDQWMDKQDHSPGFNFFMLKSQALKYLDRFPVRKPELIVCDVTCMHISVKPSNKEVLLAERMLIRSAYWHRAAFRANVDGPRSQRNRS